MRTFYVLSGRDTDTLPAADTDPASLDLSDWRQVLAHDIEHAAHRWMWANAPCPDEGFRGSSILVTDGSAALARFRVQAQWDLLITVEAEADPDDM